MGDQDQAVRQVEREFVSVIVFLLFKMISAEYLSNNGKNKVTKIKIRRLYQDLSS